MRSAAVFLVALAVASPALANSSESCSATSAAWCLSRGAPAEASDAACPTGCVACATPAGTNATHLCLPSSDCAAPAATLATPAANAVYSDKLASWYASAGRDPLALPVPGMRLSSVLSAGAGSGAPPACPAVSFSPPAPLADVAVASQCAAAVLSAAAGPLRHPSCAALVEDVFGQAVEAVETATETAAARARSRSSVGATFVGALAASMRAARGRARLSKASAAGLGSIAAETVETMCRSPCLAVLPRAIDRVRSSCAAAPSSGPTSASSLPNPAAAAAATARVACARNSDGRRCGSIFTAALAGAAESGWASLFSFSSAGVSAADPRQGLADALSALSAAAVAADASSSYSYSSSPVRAQQPSADPLPAGLTCDDFRDLIPEVLRIRDSLGCCFGEVFLAYTDQEVIGQTAFAITDPIIRGLQQCGVAFENCDVPRESAAILTAEATFAVPAADAGKLAADPDFATALGDDVAAASGVDRERVLITNIDPAQGTVDPTNITVSITILGDGTQSTGLREISGAWNASAAAEFVPINADLAAGGDGAASIVRTIAHPHVISVELAPGENPSTADSGAASAAAAMPRTVLAGLVLLLVSLQ